MTPRRAVEEGPARPLLEVRVLGPLEVLVSGELITVGGPRPRALLTVLATEPGSTVTLGRLIETIWDGEEPDGAANTLQVNVSRLRKALGPAAAALLAASGGYRLDVPAETVDLVRFERLADRGHALLGTDPDGAAAVLAEALDLWRGEPLADLGDAAQGLRARLEARRLAAAVDLVDAGLAVGRHADLLPRLEQLVRQHPLDEGLVARQMTALYRSGRQADALAAYAAAAGRLDEELGVDPGAQLRALHQQVLRQEVPAPEQAPTRPVADAQQADTGRGAPQSAVAVPASAAAPVVPASLGRPRLPMVGRLTDLELARERLADPQVRLLTLLGLGGTGKTRMALELAHDRPAGGAVLVALAGVEDPGSVLPEICAAAGAVPAWAGEPVTDTATRALADQAARSPDGRLLLVLDNLEQLVDTAAEDLLAGLELLLDRVPTLTLLATSRSRLQLAGEFLLPLGPLPVPPDGCADPEQVLAFDAVRLYRDRAVAAAPDFVVTAANAADVATLCRMLDGLPLALELAAARVRMLPPAEVVRRGEEARLGLVAGGARSLPDRHRSIRAALDWSAALLDPDELAVFARLSVFVGGWTVEAAQRVCTSDDLDEWTVLDVLARLVDKSLVVADGSGRSWLLELVREYAAGLLAERPQDAARAVAAHREHHLELAERLAPRVRTGHDARARAELAAEAGNLGAALDRLQASGDGERLARLVVAMLDWWFSAGALGDADRWVAAAQAAEPPAEVRAQLHLSAGNLALVGADLARASVSFEAAQAAAAGLGDHALLARIAAARAVVARYRGALDDALDHLEVAGAMAERAGVAPLVTMIGNERGEVLAMLGRGAEGRPLVEVLRRWAGEQHSLGLLASALGQLALIACAEGDRELADDLAGQSLAAAEQSGVTPVLADALTCTGLLRLHLGDPAAARRALRRALRVHQEASQLLTLPGTACLLGAALVAEGELTAGARALAAGTAWRAARGLGVEHPLAGAAVDTARAVLAAGLPAADLAAAEEAGAGVPFGSVAGLEDLLQARVIDLRDPAAATAQHGRPTG